VKLFLSVSFLEDLYVNAGLRNASQPRPVHFQEGSCPLVNIEYSIMDVFDVRQHLGARYRHLPNYRTNTVLTGRLDSFVYVTKLFLWTVYCSVFIVPDLDMVLTSQ